MEEAQDVPDSAPAEKEAVGEAKPTMSEPDTRFEVNPAAIRSAVTQGFRHVLQYRFGN